MVLDLLAGHRPADFVDTVIAYFMPASGMRTSAVLAPQRLKNLPDVPTAAEGELPNL